MPRKKAPAAEVPRLVAYYRYSGGSRQTEQSIEGQRRDCEAYARAHGMTILREYVDRHISGKTDDRPAFQQLVADSAKHTFDAVICWKTDRLARNRYDSAVYKKKLRDNGVEILYAAESNISGAEGIIIEGLMEALAEYYSAELAEKARRGMRESALKGKALGSSRPLGLTVDADKHYIIEPTGAEAVRYIFEQYAAGLSSSSIVERLNAMGLRTSHGGPFNKSSINRIIQNEMYRGVYVSKKFDVRIEGAIPAIIDNDLWERAQNMFERNRQSRTPHASRADYILSGKTVLRRVRLPDEGRLRPQQRQRPDVPLLRLPRPLHRPRLHPQKHPAGRAGGYGGQRRRRSAAGARAAGADCGCHRGAAAG